MEYSDFLAKLMNGLIEGKELSFFAQELSNSISKTIIITNENHRVIISHGNFVTLNPKAHSFIYPTNSDVDVSKIDLLSSNRNFIEKICWKLGESNMEGFRLPLASKGQLLGYCYIASATDLSEQDQQFIYEAAFPTLLALLNLFKWNETQDRNQSDFIRDILYNNYDSYATISLNARNWNWDLSGLWTVAIVNCDNENLKLILDVLPRNTINKCRPLVLSENKQVIILIPVSNGKKNQQLRDAENYIESLINTLKLHQTKKMQIGIGSLGHTIENLYKVYLEAKIALELGEIFDLGNVCYFEQVGILKFIFTHPAHELQEFSQRVLGNLTAYDQENDSDLILTLKVYFKSCISIPDCARALYIHDNTLRNRLKKIEQLTGYDLHRVDHLSNLYVALQIEQIGQKYL